MGIDLAAAVDVTLLDSSVHTIPTGITGPVYHAKDSALGALLFGRASSSVAGLIVIPGVINADSTNETVVNAFTLAPPLTITKGTLIAQLILYQKRPVDNDIFRHIPRREASGVGSKNNMVVSLVQKLQQQPVIPVRLRCNRQQCTVHVMADTRADVTIISERAWPTGWPLKPAVDAVQGVGGGSVPKQSVDSIQFILPEGQTVTARPYVRIYQVI